MPAHQCPRCPLRFSFRTEVEYHVATDHGRTRPRQRETKPAQATSASTEDIAEADR